ncbi:hypothetical protein QQF64_022473 [Cirrhinus molitorella]|uniref:Uncharacterized protein n=1 Tax=Cirrhinus molitorella TaxID=172907 RepID=A0ABR3L2I2_9TELE
MRFSVRKRGRPSLLSMFTRPVFTRKFLWFLRQKSSLDVGKQTGRCIFRPSQQEASCTWGPSTISPRPKRSRDHRHVMIVG